MKLQKFAELRPNMLPTQAGSALLKPIIKVNSHRVKIRYALNNAKMFTKVSAIADIHAPIFGPVFS